MVKCPVALTILSYQKRFLYDKKAWIRGRADQELINTACED